jgi:hypothetical protein
VDRRRFVLIVYRVHLDAEAFYIRTQRDVQDIRIAIPLVNACPFSWLEVPASWQHHFLETPTGWIKQTLSSRSHTTWRKRESVIPASHTKLTTHKIASRNGMTARSHTLSASTKITPSDTRYTLPRLTWSVPRTECNLTQELTGWCRRKRPGFGTSTIC